MPTAMPLTNRIIIDSSKETIHRTLEARFGDGYGQYAANGLNSKVDTWSITWAPLTLAEKQTVEAALDTVGGHGTLTWTPCGESVQKKFRLVEGKYNLSREGNSWFKITCNLEQRFD